MVRQQLRQRLSSLTAKSVGKGTGMELSIRYQIITEKHGGKLSCVSDPSKGAEFTIQYSMRSAAT
jgi:two-component system, NtrC family, sensor kinase